MSQREGITPLIGTPKTTARAYGVSKANATQSETDLTAVSKAEKTVSIK